MIPQNPKLEIAWEGSQFINHSLAIVNREIGLELLKKTEVVLALKPFEKHHFSEKEYPEFTPLAKAFNLKSETEFIIRHRWPPDFEVPEQGKLIIMQPWEFGSMPKAWFEPFHFLADQVWVYSQFNKDVYVNDGIPESKVKIIPLGVRKELYERDYEPYQLKGKNGFRFLFNGGTTFRKGIDLLLNAYLQEFKSDEDVSLIIKDIGIDQIYVNNYSSEILKITADKNNPEIIYINDDLSTEQLMSLYRACDCYVHPYRGEGFGLPIVEAMGHGLPVIVTGYGSALDFCKADFSYLLEYQIKTIKDSDYSEIETFNDLSFPEISVENLRYLMRYVYQNRDEAREKGQKGRDFILNNFTWKNTAEVIVETLKELRDKPVYRENTGFYQNEYFKQGILFFKNEDYTNAYKFFKNSDNLNDNSAEINYYLGLTAYKLNLFTQGLQYLGNAYKKSFKGKEGYKYMALCLEGLKDYRTAEIIWKKYNSADE